MFMKQLSMTHMTINHIELKKQNHYVAITNTDTM